MEQPTESSQPTNSVVSSKTAAAPTPASAPTPPLLANQDEYVQRIDNTISAIEDQNLVHDERYAQLKLLKSKIIDGSIIPGGAVAEGSTENGKDLGLPSATKNPMTTEQINHLRAQIAAYKMLARNEPLPKPLLNQANGRRPDDCFPASYEYPVEIGDGEKLPYDLSRVLFGHQARNMGRQTVFPVSKGIDPKIILEEREHRIQNRIGQRIQELNSLPMNISSNMRLKAEIELRALRMLNFQTQMRNEVLGYLKRDTTLETALNPYAYRRTKRHELNDARITDRLEKQRKVEQERRRRQKHAEMLQAIVQASKEFKEFHKNAQVRIAKMRKSVATYHANSEKERKKDELRNEKMRMQRLMEEDDVGYRQLLDEKKDKRLVFLLQQTDEYVESLTGLVKQHQATEKKRKRDEKKDVKKMVKMQEGEELFVAVRNCVTGEVLKGEDAPKMDEIEEWMDKNPGYEVISRDAVSDSDGEKSDEEEEKPLAAEEDIEKVDEFEGLDEEQRNRRIIEKARNEEDEYDQKTKSQMESYYATAHRIKEKVVKQHSTLGGGNPNLQLKPYQIKGLEWMVSLYNNNLNGILADEMGLGKTIQTVALITYLMEVKKVNGPYLIIVPLSTISNWSLELLKWAPHVITIIFKGDREARKRLETSIKKGAFNVLLTTYDYVLREKAVLGKIRWKYMIIDEGHRMKNHNSKLTLTLNAFFMAQHRILLTGTPLQNKLPELWALLNFLLPSIFSSCGTFEQWFNAPFATTGEKVELNQEETMLIIRRLHKVLRPFLLRRLKKEVESQLPEKTEYVIKCDMSALQRILYKHLQKGLLIDSKHQGGRALMNTVVHLRKLCNHPFLFETVEQECAAYWKEEMTEKHLYRVAGKFELLDRILPKLKATGHRVLIFCQMTQLMTIMEDFFTYRGWRYMRLDGSTKQEERGAMLKDFNAPNSDYFLFMLSTRAGGLGLNLQTADTVIIFDSDWNPHQDMQAQDRAHRIGQTREVRVLRLITTNSVEEKILAAARFKLNVDEKVIQAGKFDQRSTGAERRQMLEAIIRAENEENEDDEVTEDQQVNEYLARTEEELELFNQMDIDRRREEAQDPNRKPRLIEESEIPDTIMRQSQLFTENEEKLQPGGNGGTSTLDMSAFADAGRRRRKDVNYSQDLMSDNEWLKSIDDAFGEEDSDGDDDAGGAAPSPSGSGATRKRKMAAASSEDGAGGEVKKTRKKKKRISPEEVVDSDEELKHGGSGVSGKKRRLAETGDRERLTEQLNKALNALINYKTRDERDLAEPFIQLPSRRELPQYYEFIERPMDLNRVKKKIKDGKYASLAEMSEDVDLLCTNAQRFNREDSVIYNDSILLHAVWKRVYDGLRNAPPSTAHSSVVQHSASSTPVTTTEDGSSSRAETPKDAGS